MASTLVTESYIQLFMALVGDVNLGEQDLKRGGLNADAITIANFIQSIRQFKLWGLGRIT